MRIWLDEIAQCGHRVIPVNAGFDTSMRGLINHC
jgi:hypothetical protein